jgi:hypothetical protein
VASVILVVCLVATLGILDYTGVLSGGFSMLSGELQGASGKGLAEIEASGSGLIADTFTGDQLTSPTCSATPRDSYIQLVNIGTDSGTVVGVTITSGGSNSEFEIVGPCAVGPSGSATAVVFVIFRGLTKLANSPVPKAGQQYTGTVVLATGTPVLFIGQFSQGHSQVSATSVVLQAADFGQGKPVNATCSTTPPTGSPYITLNNVGTAGATVTQVAIMWKNATTAFSIGGSCFVGPDGASSATTYVVFGSGNALSVAAVVGQSFTGTVTLLAGTPVQFSGEFK